MSVRFRPSPPFTHINPSASESIQSKHKKDVVLSFYDPVVAQPGRASESDEQPDGDAVDLYQWCGSFSLSCVQVETGVSPVRIGPTGPTPQSCRHVAFRYAVCRITTGCSVSLHEPMEVTQQVFKRYLHGEQTTRLKCGTTSENQTSATKGQGYGSVVEWQDPGLSKHSAKLQGRGFDSRLARTLKNRKKVFELWARSLMDRAPVF